MPEKVGLEHSTKSKKYELEGSCNDPVHKHVTCSFMKAAKLRRECNEGSVLGMFLGRFGPFSKIFETSKIES